MANNFYGDNGETEAMIDDLTGDFAPGTASIDENYEFDTSETSEGDLATGGIVDKDGDYHFEVEKVEFNLALLTPDGKPNTPHLNITCVVLESAKNQSPAGSRLWHKIYVAQADGSKAKKGSIESMERFALGLGLLRFADVNGERKLVSVATGKTGFKISEFAAIVKRQFCAKVKKEASSDPKYADQWKIPMGRAMHPNHPDASTFPKNKEAMIAAGYAVTSQVTSKPAAETKPAGNSSAASATSSTASSAAKSTPVTVPAEAESSGNDWDIDSL